MELNIPIGFKFDPKDKDLVGHYLVNKIQTNACKNPFIRDCDVFRDDLEIWEIWSQYGGDQLDDDEDEALYFFSSQPRASRSRFSRRIGSGTWAGEDSGQTITTSNNVTGVKKRFRYETKDKLSSYNGGWIMHVYSLLSPEPVNGNNVVLCKIKKNPRVIKKRRPSQHVNATNSNVVQQDSGEQIIVLPTESENVNIKQVNGSGDHEEIDDAVWDEAYRCLEPVPEIGDMVQYPTADFCFDIACMDMEDTTMPGFSADGYFQIIDMEDTTMPGFSADGSFQIIDMEDTTVPESEIISS